MPRTEIEFIIKANDKKLDELNKKLDSYEKQAQTSALASNKLDISMGSMAKSAGAAALAYISVSSAIGEAKEIVNAGLAFEALDQKLRFATGSTKEGAAAFAFVREESDRLGLNLLASADGFAKLSAAAKGTSIEGQMAREIFKGVSEAATALNLSADQTSGALTAIEQIISKGTVSAEELRGQLGERLPGAFQIAARSIGVTTQELGKMLEQGQVASDTFLPAFAKELQKTFSEDATKASESARASFERFNNAILELRASIAESGVLEFLTDLTNGVTDFVNSFKEIEDRSARQLINDITELNEEIIKLEEKTRDKSFFAIFDVTAKQNLADARAEFDRLIAAYNKIATSGGNTGLVAIEQSAEKVTKQVGDWNLALVESYRGARSVANAMKDAEANAKAFEQALADEARFQQFAQSIGYAVEGALTNAIVQSLEGDFDPQSILKGLGSSLVALGVAFEFQVAQSVAAGIAEGTAEGASGFGAIAIGAGLIGASNVFGGSKDSKTKLSFDEKGQRAFDDLIATIEKNNEILQLTRPGTAEALSTDAIKKAIDEAQTRLNQLNISVALGSGTAGTREDIAVQEKLLGELRTELTKQQIGDQKDLSKYYDLTAKKAAEIIKSQGGGNINTFLDRLAEAGEKANDIFYGLSDVTLTNMDEKLLEIARNAPEAVDALKEMNDEISSAADNFISMAKTLSDVQDNQQGFIDKNIALVQTGQQNIGYLTNRLAIEDREADLLRERIASGDASAENITQLAKEEQDVLNIAQLAVDAFTTQFGSTGAAQQGIGSVLGVVQENQAQTFTLEQQMLTEAQTTNATLFEINAGISDLKDTIAAQHEENRTSPQWGGGRSNFVTAVWG